MKEEWKKKEKKELIADADIQPYIFTNFHRA